PSRRNKRGARPTRACAPSTQCSCRHRPTHKRWRAPRPHHRRSKFPRRRVRDQSENSKREARNSKQIPMTEIQESSKRRPGGIGLALFLLPRFSNLKFGSLRWASWPPWLILEMLPLAPAAWAHEARPAYLELKETAPGQFSVLWRTPVLSGMRLSIVLKIP